MTEIMEKNECPHCGHDEYMKHESRGGTYLRHSDILQCPKCRKYYWMSYRAVGVTPIHLKEVKEDKDGTFEKTDELCPKCGDNIYNMTEGFHRKMFGKFNGFRVCGSVTMFMHKTEVIRESKCDYFEDL
jgi:ssDNA-binding Zn-finger/Zn-ribbon topoisomerase 1